MSFQDIPIKAEYRSLIDNMVIDFYIPLLSQAISYKRAVGYFSSPSLVEVSKGISALIENGGNIKLVASPILSEEDIKAIIKGYAMREAIIKAAVIREMHDVSNEYERDRLNLLANLIADGILDIKIAFIEDEKKMGMYHEKMGIITDSSNNKVAFSGSMNETLSAMTLNYEAIDVFCSWKGEEERILAKEKAFASIWGDNEPNIKIISFPELKDEIIRRYRVAALNLSIDKIEYYFDDDHADTLVKERHEVFIPDNITLYDYQIDAIAEWEKNNYCGIFDMATGTGKTYTGLGAVAKLSESLDNKLAVFIACPYQHLVEQWVDDIEKFNMKPIIGYSASVQKDWRQRLANAIRDQKLKVHNREFFCFVCTNATFSSDYVQNQIRKIRGTALLVADEAHNFGSENLSKLLSNKFDFRLALSATIERHGDEEGTAIIYEYFGKKCINYSLERAISEKKLTEYKYHPIIVTLNEQELRKYEELTYELSKCVLKGRNGKLKLSELGKFIALERARLVAGAERKINKLEKYIYPYIDDKHILVYCGAAKILREGQDLTGVDDADIRQIDAVTDLLGNKLNMKVSQFTSREDIIEREVLKKEFAEGETLQALIAIKCLDEGVNIPRIKVAFILASTTNPKEYIQRRGRVLRLASGKEFAEIYDFITLPRPLNEVSSLTEDQLKREISLVKNELCRGEEFARIAMNMVEAQAFLDKIKEAYLIKDHLITFKEDYGYERNRG